MPGEKHSPFQDKRPKGVVLHDAQHLNEKFHKGMFCKTLLLGKAYILYFPKHPTWNIPLRHSI